MPTLSRWFVKTALVSLVLALALGALLAAAPAFGLPAWIGALAPLYFHLFMVGWVLQLIFGVAYWMFPKASRERPRGSEALGWTSYAALNAGLLLRVLAEPAQALRPSAPGGAALAVSAALQLLAGAAFVLNTWTRARER